ncbi:hypothetical protein N035_006225 [Klebsiella pneumoniae EGD-HP19-C]|nr:DUF551 domain-containing protein [Klebsiella pneumoniae]EXF41002.1 hypothetical protein N035_006225 [Klebsiella pneumoniae EGD-HP19-C]
MTSKLTKERLQEIAEDGFLKHGESKELARMALAAMDSESWCLPLDYLQGHKDGLEWAAQLAEANHPETGDWLYDDPIELAKAIRKGPDMPPAQSVADSEPVIVVGDDGGDALSYRRLIQSFEPGTKLYRHAQPVPAVPGKWIPVSERMPDDDDFVYIWPRPDFGVELHVGQYCECSPKGDGWYAQVYEQNYGIEWHPITVTHWMPLPAGPQGVKGE